MDADLMQRPDIGWIVFVVEEEEDDWSGVYDCGAIFRPDERDLSESAIAMIGRSNNAVEQLTMTNEPMTSAPCLLVSLFTYPGG